jgi:hypothetical protein
MCILSASRVAFVGAAVAGAMTPPCPARAYTVEQNVGFTVVNQNPWTSGNSFFESWNYDKLRASLTVPISPVSLNPMDALAELLGVPLPSIGFARLQAQLSGAAGLDLGYYVDGGRMNLQYPGVGRFEFATRPGTNIVSTVGSTRVQSSFRQGFARDLVTATPNMIQLGGLGYDERLSIPSSGFGTFREAGFKTWFPTAAAWADLDYKVSAGVVAQAGLARIRKPFGDTVYCIGCIERSVSLSAEDKISIVHANPQGVSVIGAGRLPLFDRKIALGAGSVTVSYPDVGVQGRLVEPTRLAGSAAKPILQFDGDLEKMLPVVGAFLHQSVPGTPFSAKLLGISGGPTLSLYQDFEVALTPQIEMVFSAPVRWNRADGSRVVTRSIPLLPGESFDWTPIVGSGSTSGRYTVQPRYGLGGQVSNRTGFAIGFQAEVEALEVDLGIARLGPVHVASFRDDAAIKLDPFYAPDPFALKNTVVTGASFELLARSPVLRDGAEVGNAELRLHSYAAVGDPLADGRQSFDLVFAAGAEMLHTRAAGRLLRRNLGASEAPDADSLGTSDFYEVMLDLGSDLALGNDDGLTYFAGSVLCLLCYDFGAGMADAASPSFVDGAERVFFNTLRPGEFRLDDPSDPNPWRLHAEASDPSKLLPTVFEVGAARPADDFGFGPPPTLVPEPASAALMLTGVLGLVGWRQRRLAVAA